MTTHLDNLSRQQKRLIMIAADLILLPLALWTALALWTRSFPAAIGHSAWLFVIAPLVAVPVFAKLGLYRAVVRYMHNKAIRAVLSGVTLSVALLVFADLLDGNGRLPRPVFVIYWLLSVLYIGGSRWLVRIYYRRMNDPHAVRQRVAIYGAGSAGAQLAVSMRADHEYRVVAFLDDNPELHGSLICDIPVHDPARLAELIGKQHITQVLLALPSVSAARRKEIINRLAQHAVHVKTIPALHDLVAGSVRVDSLRDLEIADLLGRETIPPSPELLRACVTDRAVLVTGAGGSIGSELCRQILPLNPRRLVLLELSEHALYQIRMEMQALKTATNSIAELVPFLGSVTDTQLMERVLRTFEIETVYHAAAYKHVPLVEKNPVEGIRNNIFGTWHLAEAARATGVKTFVMISTDKAVRSTSVMGATKRFAELVIQALARQGGPTRYVIVRFGNVLGSSGSVVPLFRTQIEQGGPVTVTHPDMIRYFMTITEAAQLVLQSGALGTGGDVFVLDMGTPVRIVDLARRMIHLSGLTLRDESHPGGDIAIEYTGLRPGEKLREELFLDTEVRHTEHPLILRANETEQPWEAIHGFLARFDGACEHFDAAQLRRLLREGVPSYRPLCEFEDYLWAPLKPPEAPASFPVPDSEQGIALRGT